METGAIKIWGGKGGKNRTVFVGVKARKLIRKYLRTRKHLDPKDPLFATQEETPLMVWGLRQIIRRSSLRAGLKKEPGVHDFRRAFAITAHRNGMDPITLSRQMGHTSLEVLKRYLAQNEDDMREAHQRYSPVDNADF